MPLSWTDRHSRLIGLLYLLVVPAALVAIAIAGAVQHQQTNSRFQRLAKQGAGAHTAICALRDDLSRRADATRVFLKENPNGIPGIPVAVLRSSLANQEMTITALAGLVCPSEG